MFMFFYSTVHIITNSSIYLHLYIIIYTLSLDRMFKQKITNRVFVSMAYGKLLETISLEQHFNRNIFYPSKKYFV